MLSLILPPIGIALCVAFLFWLFFKKRGMIQGYSGKDKRSEIINPPKKEDERDEQKKETPWLQLGRILFRVIKSSCVWLWSILVGRFLRERRDGYQEISDKKESDNLGVSAVMEAEGGEIRKEMREISSSPMIPSAESMNKQRARSYFGGRPMISDEVTLPQKKGEKDKYEQVLIERIALNPKDIEAYERLGDYYMDNENLDDAKECFKQVLRLSPLSRRARFRMRRIEKNLSRRR
jgi:tetratricopeptide (TPR) repeat protein